MPVPQSDTEAQPEAEPEIPEDGAQTVSEFTTSAGWWATMAREWANQELIKYLSSPEMRQHEAERVYLDFEHEQQVSETYLADMHAACDVANDSTAALTEAGHAEVNEAYRAAILPLRVGRAFDVVKHRVSMIMNNFRQRVTTLFAAEITVTDLPAIERGPAALPAVPMAAAPLAAIPEPDEQEARVERFSQYVETGDPDTLIPGMPPRERGQSPDG